jgi:predicted O-methyltransferase YrrM
LDQEIMFVQQLTGVSVAESKAYLNELRTNIKFRQQYEENLTIFNRRLYSGWYPGIGVILGELLYVICRKLRPEKVVETGVAGGMSSSYILCALENNCHGELYSIDLPGEKGIDYLPDNKHSGWLIPNYLKSRWQLILGSSLERLPPLLEQLGKITIFLHDSEHSYTNMLFEFQVAWQNLSIGGLLLSHNIDMNNAFSDFVERMGNIGHSYNNMGGIVKL